MKAKRNKTAWLSRLKKTGTVPKSEYHDGIKWPTAIPNKQVDIYPPRPEGYQEARPHYEAYIDPELKTPKATRPPATNPVDAESYDDALVIRCKRFGWNASPKVCEVCKAHDECTQYRSDLKRACVRCGEPKLLKFFPGTLEVSKDFEGWCRVCIAEYVDSITHPVDRGAYFGPPGRRPARDGCTFCGDGSVGVICQFCVTELSNYSRANASKLYRMFYNNPAKREAIEMYSRITEAAISRVEQEYKDINQNYFEFDEGRLIAYTKENNSGKSKVKTVGAIPIRRKTPSLDRDNEETVGGFENPTEISICPFD